MSGRRPRGRCGARRGRRLAEGPVVRLESLPRPRWLFGLRPGLRPRCGVRALRTPRSSRGRAAGSPGKPAPLCGLVCGRRCPRGGSAGARSSAWARSPLVPSGTGVGPGAVRARGASLALETGSGGRADSGPPGCASRPRHPSRAPAADRGSGGGARARGSAAALRCCFPCERRARRLPRSLEVCTQNRTR